MGLESTTTSTWATTQTTAAATACFEENVAYEPLDMLGQMPTVEMSAKDCQARCRRVIGCAHFSFWAVAGHCHIQDNSAKRQPNRPQFTSGMNVCGTWRLGNKWWLKCFEQAVYFPVMESFSLREDDEASSMNWIDAVKVCMKRCNTTSGCSHFALKFPERQCSLSGDSAHKMPMSNAVAGPPSIFAPSCQAMKPRFEEKFQGGIDRIGEANLRLLAIFTLVATAVAACLAMVASWWRSSRRSLACEHVYSALQIDAPSVDEETTPPGLGHVAQEAQPLSHTAAVRWSHVSSAARHDVMFQARTPAWRTC